ncbi:MAG TPA: NYN domain-containing protein [Candidatus Paceibacterota bacterium]|nr:NYN domain-containing protein [Candidatus Paceibacterota bacterium]
MSVFSKNKKPIYVFIDASNLFYGGERSLGWKIDYNKLWAYLKQKYGASEAFYYGGIELYDFNYSILDYYKPIDLTELIEHLTNKLKEGDHFNEAEILLLGKHIQRAKFYRKLESFGYKLRLKPVKIYYGDDEKPVKKANCDVDMTFDLMRLMEKYSGAVILSGDGDFVPVLSYLRHKERAITVLARSERTAREIKQLVGGDFKDFHYLREILKYEAEK